ncbi:hypothetical protein Glove_60g113 [Diversispora epigaea]|uniref:Uncharacterized protein n=1 Tax=Diversispora epigaea TaxID=1348612 RepID=A0A397JCK1_9GLOM|nr:hypothetical protein Glove_60g113 [Diversispora epigaea]
MQSCRRRQFACVYLQKRREEDPIREKIIQNKPNIEDSTIKNRLNMVTCLNYCGEIDYRSTKHGLYLTFFKHQEFKKLPDKIIKGFVPDLPTYKVTEICKDKRMAVRIIMETFENFQNVLKDIWKDRYGLHIIGGKSDEEKEYLKEK